MEIRRMRPDEAKEARNVARKAFGSVEGLFVTKFEDALIAVLDEKIVGGFVYKISNYGGKKIGFVSFLFIDPSMHGQGLGSRLTKEGIQHLWEKEKCDALVTFVRDDNVASWGTFKNNGFVQVSLSKIARFVGLLGLVKLYFTTGFYFAIGHDFYFALRDGESAVQYKNKGGIWQIVGYILINILFLAGNISRIQHVHSFIAAIAIIFPGMVFAGYIGTLFSNRDKREWSFRFIEGGFIVYMLINIFGIFPLIGGWYPVRYENTPEFKRDMGINAASVWVFLLCLKTASLFIDNLIMAYISSVVTILIILRCLPIPVFYSAGFGRIYSWNKIVFGLLAAASIYFVLS